VFGRFGETWEKGIKAHGVSGNSSGWELAAEDEVRDNNRNQRGRGRVRTSNEGEGKVGGNTKVSCFRGQIALL